MQYQDEIGTYKTGLHKENQHKSLRRNNMETLQMIRFPSHEIKLNVVNRDVETLASISRQSKDPDAPEKVREVYDNIKFPKCPDDRPYTFGSMVLSVDGKIAYTDDPQGPLVAARNMLDPLGGKADFWVLNMLRAYCDCSILGARTIQAEPKGTSHVFCEELAEARVAEMGKTTRHPWNCVVSLDGTDIPFAHMLFDHAELRPMVATSPDGAEYVSHNMGRETRILGPYATAAHVDREAILETFASVGNAIPVIATGKGKNTDAAALLYILRLLGVEKACIESPQYLWHLVEYGMLDEFFINYSSVFVGGPIALGSHRPFSVNNHPHSRLLSVATHANGFIFTRQQLVYNLSDG
jgi:riboflavin biosynthesis pyrimidine reductase